MRGFSRMPPARTDRNYRAMRRPLEQSGETVGARLRRLRLARGLTQRDLAGPGVSYAYISRIEAGARQPSVKALRRLAAKLGVEVTYLEIGVDLGPGGVRELRLADAELRLRLGESVEEAVETLTAVLADAEAAGDEAAVHRARADLGLAAMQRGDHLGAIAVLEESLADDGASPDPETVLQLARAYLASGRSRQAADLLQRAIERAANVAETFAVASVRYAALLGRSLANGGELERARDVVEDALEASASAHDPLVRARLVRDQARLAAENGELQEALRASRLALALLDATETQRQLGRAHLLAAELHDAAGVSERASAHLAAAERLLGQIADADDRSWLDVERARQTLATDPERAAELAEHAALGLEGTGDAERGAAWLVVAKARERTGQTEWALEAYAQATELLERARMWPDAVAARRGWAQLLRTLSRVDEAATVLDQGLALAVETGQQGLPGRY